MPKPLFRPPTRLIKEWPEVFEDLYMNTMPVAYLDLIRLEFADGRVWEVDVKAQLKNHSADDIADKLFETIQEYRGEIAKIDFDVDIKRLKKDIQDSTDEIF